MVKHVILWTLKEEFSEEEKQQIKSGIKEGLEGLAGQIPGLLEIHVQTESLQVLMWISCWIRHLKARRHCRGIVCIRRM